MALSKNALGGLTIVILLGVVAGATYLRIRPDPSQDPGQTQVDGGSGETPVMSAQEQFNAEIPQPVSGRAAVQDTLWVSVSAAGQATRTEGVDRGVA